MNSEYELFAEAIAMEAVRRQQVLDRIGKRNPPDVIAWEDFSEEQRQTYVSVVRSMILDGEIIPGTNYVQPDPYEAKEVLKKKLGWDDPNSNPMQDIKDHVRSQRDRVPDFSLEEKDGGHGTGS